VFHDTEWLVAQIETIEVTLERWHQFRADRLPSVRQKALACLVLNRTSYSGILARRAGPIGGQKQESSYKIDCRFPRKTLIARIRHVARLRDSVAFVWNCSWQTGITRLNRMQQQGRLKSTDKDTFYYLDPPFFEKADRLYTHYFSDRDHLMLRKKLLQLRAPWVLSYDAADAVETLYGNCQAEKGLQVRYINVQYTAARSEVARTTKREAIITRKEIKLPQHVAVKHTRAKSATFMSDDMPEQVIDATLGKEQILRVGDSVEPYAARTEGAAR